MAKTIMLSDDAYQMVKRRKPKHMSFSEFLKFTYSPSKNSGKAILDFLNTVSPIEKDTKSKAILKEGWERWNKRSY